VTWLRVYPLVEHVYVEEGSGVPCSGEAGTGGTSACRHGRGTSSCTSATKRVLGLKNYIKWQDTIVDAIDDMVRVERVPVLAAASQ
jgi:hypothetical protein